MGEPGPGCPRGRIALLNEQPCQHKERTYLGLFTEVYICHELTVLTGSQVEDDIEGCFQRPTHLDITVASREYAPTAGIKPLREAVAKMYNEHHRKGKPSQYTWENVAIVPGGRAGLIRIAAVLNQAYLGFFIPDYTAYNEMLSLFRNVSPIWPHTNMWA